MQSNESAAERADPALLESVEVETGDAPQFSIVWLHGLGADGHDFVPAVPHIWSGAPPVRFVFPHAPIRPVTLNGGMRMRAWYDLRGLDIRRDQDEEGILRSAAAVEALVAREVRRGTPPSRIVLAGFSQGGAVAAYVALRFPERLAGLVALSTYLLFPERLTAERHDANADLPIFVGHGTMDPIVPFALGESFASTLRQAHWPVAWHAYPMPHSVCAEEIADLSRWMRGVIA